MVRFGGGRADKLRAFVFRVDASTEIGTGHLMRCLTLADELRGEGAWVFFVCRELAGNLCDLVAEKGYSVYRLPAAGEQGQPGRSGRPEQPRQMGRSEQPVGPPVRYAHWLGVDWQTDAEQTKEVMNDINKEGRGIDWLVVDHYALDKQWEQQMCPYVERIMVIDDLADREHDCDLLLDQNLHRDLEKRYDGLVPGHCRRLLGPRYALLRPEFAVARENLRKRDGTIRRMLIFFGGCDPTNETAKTLQAVSLLDRPEIAVDVVVGGTNPHQEQMRMLCSRMPNTAFHCQVSNMAQLMAATDLAIGAGGSTTWERCCLGLPTLIATIARNQESAAETTAHYGAAVYLGKAENITADHIALEIRKLLEDRKTASQLGERAMCLVDGRGALRTGEVMLA